MPTSIYLIKKDPKVLGITYCKYDRDSRMCHESLWARDHRVQTQHHDMRWHESVHREVQIAFRSAS